MGTNNDGNDLKPRMHELERTVACTLTKERPLLKKSMKKDVENESK
jgi:hypothetical protein